MILPRSDAGAPPQAIRKMGITPAFERLRRECQEFEATTVPNPHPSPCVFCPEGSSAIGVAFYGAPLCSPHNPPLGRRGRERTIVPVITPPRVLPAQPFGNQRRTEVHFLSRNRDPFQMLCCPEHRQERSVQLQSPA